MADLPDIARRQFAALGMECASCEVVRDFPWSYVLRVTMVDGRVAWVKRCGDGMSFEPDLVRVIESVGSYVLVPTLWIAERWIATAHVGGRLGSGADLIGAVARLQRPLAELQKRLSRHLDAVRAASTPTLGPADVGALLERALELGDRDAHLAERPLTRADERAVRAAVPRLTHQVEAIESAAPVMTVQHLDLHHGNVFDDDGHVRLFDWGDARIGSPLLHVVSTLSILGYIVGVETRDARLSAVAQEYLAQWPEVRTDADTDELLHDPRIAALVRIDALTAALCSGTEEQLAPFADWLADLVRAAASPDPADARGVRLA